MSSGDQSGWSFATAREPVQFGMAVHPRSPGIKHAGGDGETLCGIVSEELIGYLCYFERDHASSCTECARIATAWPTQPCAQERLHDFIQAAPAGAMRDELASALRQGAAVKLWVRGSAASIGKHYGHVDRIVEGRAEVEAAFAGRADEVGLARVLVEPWMFVVVLPADSPPVIARASAAHQWSLPTISQEE